MGQRLPNEEEKDPIDEALAIKKKLAAGTIIDGEIAAAQAKIDRAGSGGGGGTQFIVKGGVDIGTIDLQAERARNEQLLTEAKKEAEAAVRTTGQDNVQLREKIHDLEMAQLAINLEGKIQGLTQILEAKNVPQKTFIDQYKETMELVETMKSQMGVQPGQMIAPELQIQILKLDHEHTLTIESLHDAREDSRRKWEIELRRIDDDRADKKAELDIKRQQNQSWGQGFEVVGKALAQGFMEGGGEGAVAQQPGAPRAPRGKKAYHIDVPLNQGGTANCPECNETVGIGPTAKKAVCPKCGVEIGLRRVTAPPATEEAPPAAAPPPEESGERQREEEA